MVASWVGIAAAIIVFELSHITCTGCYSLHWLFLTIGAIIALRLVRHLQPPDKNENLCPE